MSSHPMENITPDRALMSSRLVWCALLGGQLAFVLVILGIWRKTDILTQAEPHVRDLLRYAGVAALIVCVPLGYYLRMQTYKRYWRGSVIAPQGYFTGNLVLWALLETAGSISLAAVLVTGSFWPAGVPAGVAMALHLVNFPNGKPMFADSGGGA